MLKKAAIIAAVATAGALALTPLAFAHDWAPAPAPASSIESGNQTNDCPISQSGQDITNDLAGGDSFLGLGGAVANVGAPVSAPIGALNCVNLNVEDVIDQNSNNTTTTVDETEVEDSFNEEG